MKEDKELLVIYLVGFMDDSSYDSYMYCKVLQALTTSNKYPIIQHYLTVRFKWQDWTENRHKSKKGQMAAD